MQVDKRVTFSKKCRLLIVLLSAVGTALVLLSTSRYGAGLSPDSVQYIGAARNMAAGRGAVLYDGTPFVFYPPLYPGLLAILDYAFGIDPLSSLRIVNALLFGLIVYLSGLLVARHLTSSRAFAVLGVVVVLVSPPLLGVSVMAFPEPLFIFFVLLFLIHLETHLVNKDTTSFVILSLSAALACLSRYIGVTLILSGAMAILLFRRDGFRAKFSLSFLFALISASPIGLWAVRNYAVSGTFFGARVPSAFTLPQNLVFTSNVLLSWYLPTGIAERRSILALLGVTIGLLVRLNSKRNRAKLESAVFSLAPMILLVVVYTAFLIVSSTTTAYNTIDTRLLSPIYVPATLLLLALAERLLEPLRVSFSPRVVNVLLVIGVGIWSVYSLSATTLETISRMTEGAGGYNTKSWRESAVVQYVQRQPLQTNQVVYTNGADALYILTNLVGKSSPAKTAYNRKDRISDISELRGSWPQEGNAYLIWFNTISWRDYLFTIDELQTASNMQQIIQLGDGALYSVQRLQ